MRVNNILLDRTTLDFLKVTIKYRFTALMPPIRLLAIVVFSFFSKK